MPLLTQRILRGLKPAALNASRPPARQDQPERIVLGVRNGVRPSSKPPVRIYLGTERGQFRAERVFIWSVEKHRDSSRIYEIYLMRDLKGFKRRFWLTGFTNYRFAIPAFAGLKGKAIYNDTDQIYLKDPALLFDTPMDQAGFLSINDRDTSVMLIDCQRMSEVWNAHDVRRLGRKALEARARRAGLWAELDAGWNARDSEYDPERSHLVHFTTLHTQPWRPFPAEFVYFDNPTDPLWPNLEGEADQAGFLSVTASRPSSQWPRSAARMAPQWRTLLGPKKPAVRVPERTVDGLLEYLPDQDLPWVLERLFSTCESIRVAVDEPKLHGRHRTRRSLWYWQQQLMAAARMHPSVRWTLRYRSPWGRVRRFVGGPAEAGPVKVICHRKPGHNNQARAIGRHLAGLSGRELLEIPIQCSETGFVLRRLFGRRSCPDINPSLAGGIVVAGGWLPTRIARDMQAQDPTQRLILSGRKAGPAEALGSVLIQCRHFDLPPHPNRITTTLPLNSGHTPRASTTDRWQSWLDAERKVAVLVGGSSRSHHLDAAAARELARQASAFANSQSARLLLVTGRRSLDILDALQDGLAGNDHLYSWEEHDQDNPYGLALASSDVLMVTGESESMLADAAGRGRPFLIWPTPARRPGAWQRLSAEIADRAVRPRFNRRGSIRPQQGQTYLCARALERGWILPPRNVEKLHRMLYDKGLAAPFGQPLPTGFSPAIDELDQAVITAARTLRVSLETHERSQTRRLSRHDQRLEHS
ncbi:MAG: hypothetical protein EA419_05170 [Wenzhouxiangella sp.]|nr:MAG: hypothetical protein EA419_05170 [Wenzhouxiangella sp.]